MIWIFVVILFPFYLAACLYLARREYELTQSVGEALFCFFIALFSTPLLCYLFYSIKE